jgi:hypothetical protein
MLIVHQDSLHHACCFLDLKPLFLLLPQTLHHNSQVRVPP